jgi:hypothetical protein
VVDNFGNVTKLALAPTTYSIEPIFSGITASIVQSYYGYRLYMVSGRKKIFPVIIGILSLAQLGFAFANSLGIFYRNSQVGLTELLVLQNHCYNLRSH